MTAADRPPVEDARAEAERRWPTYPGAKPEWPEVRAFVAGAEWAASRAVPSDQALVAAPCCDSPEACRAVTEDRDRWRRIAEARTTDLREPTVPSDHTATTEDEHPAVAALRDYLTLYTLPANYWRPSAPDETHGDVARRCAPLIAAHLHDRGLLATARPDTTTVYSVQHWEDGDGINAGWVTGHGQYTTVRRDAELLLAHRQRLNPEVEFRIATAEVAAWTEADRG